MNFYITIGDIQNRIAEFHQNNDMTPDFPEILRSLYKDHKYKAETPEQQITWIDSPREKHIDFQPEKRRIPPKAIKKWEYKNNEREWSFSRKDKV